MQEWNLHEALRDQDEHVEIKRGDGAADIDEAPDSGEMERIIGDHSGQQQDERQHADRARRVEAERGQREAAEAGQDRGDEEERRPGAGVASEQQPVQDDQSRKDADQAENDMDLKHRRPLRSVASPSPVSPRRQRDAQRLRGNSMTAFGRSGEPHRLSPPSPAISAFKVATVEASASPSTRFGPEVALERGDRLPRLAVVDPRDLHAIAVEGQHRLQRPHRRALLLVGEQRRRRRAAQAWSSGRRRPATTAPTGRLRPGPACAPARRRNGRARARARFPSGRRCRAQARSSPRSGAPERGASRRHGRD